jgi:glucans biosynthesis protein
MDVDVRLYPRRDGMRVGVAPLTSMFLFSAIDRARINDFRRAVHDSDGLAIVNAGAEHIWRPLTNPKRLQVSEFLVDGVTGFGLVQRSRNFAAYGDLEANYERRPSAWIEPFGWWGKGSVHLVEIPSEEEIHDNIVAYWRPQDPYRKNEIYRFGYRIVWSNDKPVRTDKALVINTSSGLAAGSERKDGAVRYAVDFAGPTLKKNSELPTARLTWSAGTALPPIVQRNPHTGGVRVSFLLRPEGADLVEMRLELRREGQPISEVWLSRWTK